MSGAGKVVCVTGASGYVASWLVKLLLERGYTVKATVRNLSDSRKVDHLKAFKEAEERLQLIEADLLVDGSFDTVINGCECVFHTASPVLVSPIDPQAELIDPALKGTLNVLRSCTKVPSVRRVVLTASMVSVVCNENTKGPDVVVDETWFSDPEFCEKAKLWYHLSKTLGKKAAWKFAEENGIDLVVMLPGFMLGPLLQPTLNYSVEAFLDVVKGKEVYPMYDLVDVRDVAYAHILASENPSAKGRYCLVGTTLTHSEFQRILHKVYPSISIPVIASRENPPYQVSKKKAENLGIKFKPLEMSIKDAVENLKQSNSLSL